MTLPLLKACLFLSIGLFSITSSSKTNTASSREAYRITRNSTAYRYSHSLGQVRVEGEPTASHPAGYGHRYVPGQNRPAFTRTSELATEPTANSKTVKARQNSSPLIYPSYAPFVYDLNATATTLTTRTGAHSFTGPVAYTFSAVTTIGAGSATSEYQSVTIDSTQQSSPGTSPSLTEGVRPTEAVISTMKSSTILISTITIDNSPTSQSNQPTTVFTSVITTGIAGGSPAPPVVISELETLTGAPWSLPPCNGPSPGPGLTPVGCTLINSEFTLLPTTTYSWSDVANISSTSSPTPSNSLTPSWPKSNQSQSWTSDSVPCPGNETSECVINGTSTITLGLISQILGLGRATPTPSSPTGSSNLPQSWADNLSPCAGNTSLAYLVIASSTTTLGPITQTHGPEAVTATPVSPPGSVNLSQSWTSNSTPCANNKSWECVDADSGVVSLAPIASLKYSESWTSNSTPCANNKSLGCIVEGSSTVTLGAISLLTSFPSSITSDMSTDTGLLSSILSDLGILGHSSTIFSSAATSGGDKTTTAGSTTLSPIPCASNASMECLVNGNSTFTAGNSQVAFSKSISDVVTITTVTTSSLPTKSSESKPAPGNPYPYPSLQSRSVKRFKIPMFLMLFCSLVSMAMSIDVRSIESPEKRPISDFPSSTSTDIFYAPLVSSIAAILSGTSVEPDGDWGIGVPVATTSTFQQNGQYRGGGGESNSPAATSTFFQNGQYGGGGGGTQSTSPSATPASATVTHAISVAKPSFSPFPTNFIQPVTEADVGSGSEATQATSSLPVSSNTAKSGSSRLKAPLLILLLWYLVSLGAATITPRAIPLTTQILSSSRPPSPSTIMSSPGSCVSNSNFECVVQGESTITLRTISPQATGSSLTSAGPSPCKSNSTLECIVQGGNTITVGTLLQQSTLTIVPTTQTTWSAPAATSKPAKSGAFKVKIPFLSLLLCSLVSLATASITPSPRGVKFSSDANPMFSTWDLSDLPTDPTPASTTSIIPSPIGKSFSSDANPRFSSWNLSDLPAGSTTTAAVVTTQTSSNSVSTVTQGPNPGSCVSNTSFECIIEGGQTVTVGTISPLTTLQTSPSATSTTSMPSKTATSGFARVKVPRFLLLIHSFITNSWAKLVPTPPTVEEQAAQARAAKFEAMTVSLPPTTAFVSVSNQDAIPIFVVVHSSVVTVVSSPESTSQGLRRIATPFLALIVCCVAATLYSAGLGLQKHRRRDEGHGYDSGWVVQRGEYVDRDHHERKDYWLTP